MKHSLRDPKTGWFALSNGPTSNAAAAKRVKRFNAKKEALKLGHAQYIAKDGEDLKIPVTEEMQRDYTRPVFENLKFVSFPRLPLMPPQKRDNFWLGVLMGLAVAAIALLSFIWIMNVRVL